MKTAIQAKNIVKHFRGKTILDQLSFSWRPGIYCLYGSNGKGKSTLLRILAGAEREFNGTLEILKINAVRDAEGANVHRSFLPDNPSFYSKATTFDLLAFVASVRKIETESLFKEGSKKFGLEELLSKPLERQSLGQRKRSFFGVVLLKQVPIWILDEPTNGLDSYYQTIFFDCVKSHAIEGGTIVIATHDPMLADKLNGESYHLHPESLLQPVNELLRR